MSAVSIVLLIPLIVTVMVLLSALALVVQQERRQSRSPRELAGAPAARPALP
jgi:hypothetical protein